MWNPDVVNVLVLDFSTQLIHYQIQTLDKSFKALMTFVYASLRIQERKSLWEDLGKISESINIAWNVMGDFNAYCEVIDK